MTQDGCSHVKLLPYRSVPGEGVEKLLRTFFFFFAMLGTIPPEPLPLSCTPSLGTLFIRGWCKSCWETGPIILFIAASNLEAVPFPRIQAHPRR